MIKIGLTGNIASGKSTVEKIIVEAGFKVVDLDMVSHCVLENECKNDILKTFNTTDRKKLGDIVFKDKNELKKLENIIHPELKKYVLKFFEDNKNEKAVFVSGALIFEAGFSDLFDKIIFVDAKRDIRINRLMKRNSLNEEEALLRIDAQSDKFKQKADFILENNLDLKTLKENTGKIIILLNNVI